VFEAELDGLRHVVARDLGKQREAEVDARRDAAAGEAIAVAHDPLGHGDRAEHSNILSLRRVAIAKCVAALPKSRPAELHNLYNASNDSQYYDVIYWLDFGCSLSKELSSKAANKLLRSETTA
jgi:hypothetical protein